MNRVALIALLVVSAGLFACPDPPPPPPPPPNPPVVSLLVQESNVFGTEVRGSVNVSGCKTVAQVLLFHQDRQLMEVAFNATPTQWSLPSGAFANLYSQLGFATSLTLKAKATCDDGRTNTSTPIGVRFFPISQKFTGPGGEQLVPDNFLAEGGLGGSANTFLGCVRVGTGGTSIARVDSSGQLLGLIDPMAMPFNCSLATSITDLSPTSGYRWVIEPGAGAFALCLSASCGNFSVGKVIRNAKAKRLGVSRGGIAGVWIDETGTMNRVEKLYPGGNDTTNDVAINFGFPVILNADPLVDDGAGQALWVSRWEFHIGTKIANIVPYRFDLTTGQLTNGNAACMNFPCVLLQQQYPLDDTSEPIMPVGFFSPTGDTFTIPLLSYAIDNSLQTTVVSCATAFGNCQGAARRWSSPTFGGMLRLVVPFSANNIYAAVGPFQVYFLNAQSGVVMNLGERPIQPSGSNVVLGLQPGGGADFYVLTGPDFAGAFPNEIIAVDTPQQGELWRVNFGSGESPNTGMTIAIDSANAVWLRAGTDLIKPLPNNEYRMARGPTILP